MQIDLKKVNEGLKAKGKRTHQNVGPVSKEFKELATKKGRLEAQVGQLERDVRKQIGSKPAVTKASKPAAKTQETLEKLYIEQERKKLVKR